MQFTRLIFSISTLLFLASENRVEAVCNTTSVGLQDTTICVDGGPAEPAIDTGSGIDSFTMTGGVLDALDQGSGFDTAVISGGHIIGLFTNGDGVDFTGGRIGAVNLTPGNNVFDMSGTAQIDDLLNSEQGDDLFNLTGGTIGGVVSTGSGDDIINLNGTQISDNVIFEGGSDTIVMLSGTIDGSLFLDEGPGHSNGTDASDIARLSGGSITGSVLAGDGNDQFELDGTQIGGDVILEGGDDEVILRDGSIGGSVFMDDGSGFASGPDGSDIATVTGGFNMSNLTGVLDGGDDVASTDGLVDELRFAGWSGDVDGSRLLNWEVIGLRNSSVVRFTDDLLVTGSDADTGLFVFGGSTAGFAGDFSLTGNLFNSGLLDLGMDGGLPSSTLVVSGDYVGGGALRLDTELNDGLVDNTDVLVVNGDTSDSTTVYITNIDGTGAETGDGATDGIQIIVVEGVSDGEFVLGRPVAAGAYEYALNQADNQNWYLQSDGFAGYVPTYEVYRSVLLAMTGLPRMASLPTMQQRIGNRWNWPDEGGTNSTDGQDASSRMLTGDNSGVWLRMEGSRSHYGPSASTTGGSFDHNLWQLQAGSDLLLHENTVGDRLFLGLTGHHGQGSATTMSALGDGSISSQVFGFGLSATYLADNGFYLDGQARFSWLSSDLSADRFGTLTSDNGGFGRAFSVEIGKKLPWYDHWTITPQAQLIQASASFDSFTGSSGERVSIQEGDSLKLRTGVALNKDKTWLNDQGIQRSHVYLIANVSHEFEGRSVVDVSGTPFISQAPRWEGEVGLGMTRNFDNDRFSLYGEVNVGASLEDPGEAYRYGGTIGLRVRF